MKLTSLSLILLAAVCLAACVPAPTLRNDQYLKDDSLISGQPCAAPCWRGITPGQTSWAAALTILEDDTSISNIESIQPDPNLPARIVDFNDAQGGTRCCRMFSSDGETVSSVLTLLAPNLTVGQIIEEFGEPTYYVGEGVTDDQALVSMLYPDVPLIIYGFAPGVSTGQLSATSEVIGAIYLTSEDMQTIITQNNLYAWRGYGPLSSLLDGAFDITPIPTSEATPEN
ncbi:MAG: hypothetical protein NZ750_03205 [Anaerolineae bacterium]|nr:hypothetical protein [Anaerolineae bacterium]MDW8170975.1 hypothetical protein [Anaerolineae bacterium]